MDISGSEEVVGAGEEEASVCWCEGKSTARRIDFENGRGETEDAAGFQAIL